MTSLSLFPRPLALSAYSAVSGSRMTLCLAISCWIGNTYLDDSGRDSPASLNSTGDM